MSRPGGSGGTAVGLIVDGRLGLEFNDTDRPMLPAGQRRAGPSMRGPRARRRSWCWPPEKKGEAERGRRGPREPENFGLVCDDFILPPRRRKPLVSATTDRELKDVVEPSELRVKRSPVGLLYVR